MIVKLIVDGGNMKPGPAVSQQLGPMGVNLGKIIEEANKATSGFKGMKVPIAIEVDTKTKNFTIEVSSPPVAELVKKEVGATKGSSSAGKIKIGNLAIEQIISIAKTKMPGMLAKDLKAAVKLVVGSCVSAGVLIENKEAKEIIQQINSGVYDKEISEERVEASSEKKAKLEEFFSTIKSKQDTVAKEAEQAKVAEEAAKLEKASTTEEAKETSVKGDKKADSKPDKGKKK